MRPKGTELYAGIFVILSIAVFMLFLSWIGGGFQRWFAPQREVVTWFNNVAGLQEETQVTFEGVPIGKVSKIAYDTETHRIRVIMTVLESFQLPTRCVATITQSNLVADPHIELKYDLKDIQPEWLVIGFTEARTDPQSGILMIDAVDPATFGLLQAKVGYILDDVRAFTREFGTQGKAFTSLVENANTVITDVRHLTKNFDRYGAMFDNILGGAEKLMNDEKFIRNIHNTAANANSLTARIDNMVASSEDTITIMLSNLDETILNAKVLIYGLAESPWRLVWKDKTWQDRVQSRDPELIKASLRETPSDTSQKPVEQDRRQGHNRNPFAYHQSLIRPR